MKVIETFQQCKIAKLAATQNEALGKNTFSCLNPLCFVEIINNKSFRPKPANNSH
jgi:hypothetical protein